MKGIDTKTVESFNEMYEIHTKETVYNRCELYIEDGFLSLNHIKEIDSDGQEVAQLILRKTGQAINAPEGEKDVWELIEDLLSEIETESFKSKGA